jgi:hypothetical protein
MAHKIPKGYRPTVKWAMERGWTISMGGRHLKLRAPDGQYTTTIPSSTDVTSLIKDIDKRVKAHQAKMEAAASQTA